MCGHHVHCTYGRHVHCMHRSCHQRCCMHRYQCPAQRCAPKNLNFLAVRSCGWHLSQPPFSMSSWKSRIVLCFSSSCLLATSSLLLATSSLLLATSSLLLATSSLLLGHQCLTQSYPGVPLPFSTTLAPLQAPPPPPPPPPSSLLPYLSLPLSPLHLSSPLGEREKEREREREREKRMAERKCCSLFLPPQGGGGGGGGGG
jgi:hypothetical protein